MSDAEGPTADALWSKAFAQAGADGMAVYDAIIAPMFAPWARDLVERLAPALGANALDVASGPGTVTRLLADRLGPAGRVIATDISPSMLEIARAKPMPVSSAPIEWLQAPAVPLPVDDAWADVVSCQQGLQFFPQKTEALAEMRRVLRPGGRAGVAVWTAVEDQILVHLRDSVATVLSDDVAQRYLGPFSLSGSAAAAHAREAGFASVELLTVTLPVQLSGGASALFETLRASGIAGEIAALDEDTRTALRTEVARRTEALRAGESLRGSMTASVLMLW